MKMFLTLKKLSPMLVHTPQGNALHFNFISFLIWCVYREQFLWCKYFQTHSYVLSAFSSILQSCLLKWKCGIYLKLEKILKAIMMFLTRISIQNVIMLKEGPQVLLMKLSTLISLLVMNLDLLALNLTVHHPPTTHVCLEYYPSGPLNKNLSALNVMQGTNAKKG